MDITFEGVTFWLILQVFVLPVLLPALVGFVTTRVTHPRVQALLLVALNLVTALLTNLLNAWESGDAEFNLGLALVTFFVSLMFSIATHYGILKPIGITEKALDSGIKAT